MTQLRPLTDVEQRVLGALLEKELSTPDLYPLTLNSLLAACNQSSNRDPVLSLVAEQVDAALHALMTDLLVWRERGARTLRWKHLLDDKLGLDGAGKAILAELLLRGEQTPGELRGRSARMHPFAGLGEVEAVLTELAARGLAEELPRLPGQKERRWRQRLAEGVVAAAGEATQSDDGKELTASRRLFVPPPAPPRPPPLAREAAVTTPPTTAARPLPELAARLAALETQVAELTRRLEILESDRTPEG
jgi:uncharacterized protein